MTTTMKKGLLVAAVHVALVASLGAKFALDRATRPRVWVHASPYDPNLPIRGRYVRLRLDATLDDTSPADPGEYIRSYQLEVRNDQLLATPTTNSTGVRGVTSTQTGVTTFRLQEPVAYFIPEHIPDPSFRPEGEELWVEVTLPRKGMPRPIRLGVKRNGVLTPLDIN